MMLKNINKAFVFLMVLSVAVFISVKSYAAGTISVVAPTITPSATGNVPSSTPPVCPTSFCMAVGGVSSLAKGFDDAVSEALDSVVSNNEGKTKESQKDFLADILYAIQCVEKSLVTAWTQAWHEGMKEALKNALRQVNVVMMEEGRQVQSLMDASSNLGAKDDKDKLSAGSEKENRPSVHANVAASAAKGYGRAMLFSRAMRKAIPQEMINIAYTKKGSINYENSAKYLSYRIDNFLNLYCDADGNGGLFTDSCKATDENFYNADIKPTKFLYSRLTLPADPAKDPEHKTLKALVDLRANLFGVPIRNPIDKSTLNTTKGKESFMNRRGELARYGAIMSVHNFIESRRMPGSSMGSWMKDILGKTSEGASEEWYRNMNNPSYKELIHGMTIDRFNNEKYTLNLLTNTSDIRMEKLSLSALQLVQLRDYYELLERTALVLSVEVAMMVENAESFSQSSIQSQGQEGE